MRGHNICFPSEIRKLIFELSSIPPLILSSVKIAELAKRVDPDDAAHNKQPHLNLCCWSSSL